MNFDQWYFLSFILTRAVVAVLRWSWKESVAAAFSTYCILHIPNWKINSELVQSVVIFFILTNLVHNIFWTQLTRFRFEANVVILVLEITVWSSSSSIIVKWGNGILYAHVILETSIWWPKMNLVRTHIIQKLKFSNQIFLIFLSYWSQSLKILTWIHCCTRFVKL